jgi:hypothetical protein
MVPLTCNKLPNQGWGKGYHELKTHVGKDITIVGLFFKVGNIFSILLIMHKSVWLLMIPPTCNN